MIRERRLFAALLAALMVASVATLGGAAFGQSATPADGSNSVGTNGANGVRSTPANASGNGSDGWQSPRADAGRTGATGDDGPLPYGNTSWEVGNTGRDDWGPTVVGDSVVVAYTGDVYPNGIVESYAASTGETEWTQERVGNPLGPATAANGTVFVATRSDTDEFTGYENRTGLYALDASTGEVEWTVGSTFSPPVVADGHLFTSERPYDLDTIGGEYGRVTAMDPATGERLWTSDVRGRVLAYADGRLIVGDEASDTLYALDAEDGSLLWETGVDEPLYLHDGVAATGDAVYVTSGEDPAFLRGDTRKAVTAFAADDGSRLWETEVGGDPDDPDDNPTHLSAPAVANGTVYVVTNREDTPRRPEAGAVHALDADTGEREWRFRTRVNLRSDPAVANGTVYVAGMYEFEEGWIEERDAYGEADWRLPFSWLTAYALDAEDGSERWDLMTDSAPNNDGPYGSAVADGRFYVTSHETGLPGRMTLTAVESTDERPPWYFRAVDDREGLDEPDVQPRAVIDASPPGDDGYYEPNTTVSLSATNSSVEYGRIVSYEWDLDDDGEYETTGTTAAVTIDDLACEETAVSLRVTDDDGDTDTTRQTLRTGPPETGDP